MDSGCYSSLMTGLFRNVFMGRVRLTMNEVAAAGDAGITKVFTLLNENFEFSETNRGDINVSLKWIFDQATDDLNKRVLKAGSKSSIFSKISNLLRRKQVPPKVEVSLALFELQIVEAVWLSRRR